LPLFLSSDDRPKPQSMNQDGDAGDASLMHVYGVVGGLASKRSRDQVDKSDSLRGKGTVNSRQDPARNWCSFTKYMPRNRIVPWAEIASAKEDSWGALASTPANSPVVAGS
jgi:hypothetical protein